MLHHPVSTDHIPRASLSEAIRVPIALKDFNGGNPWPPEDLKKAIDSNVGNRFVTNNHFFYLTAASRDFGLTNGSRDANEISLTDLGRAYAYAGSQDEESSALQRAFFSVDVFKRVFDHYGSGSLPEEKFVTNTLENNFDLHPDVHAEFLDLYRENIRFLKLDEDRIADGAGFTGTLEPKQTLGVTTEGEDFVAIAEPDGGSDKLCFVAIPFSEKTGKYPDGFFTEVLRHLIGPAGAAAGFRVVTANRKGSDIIQSTIINGVLDSDLVVADLTEHNPNVLFELGARMATDKPVALVRAEGTSQIFDVDTMLRVFDYSPNLWKSTVSADLPNMTAHLKGTWDRRKSDRTYMKILRSPVSASVND